MSLVAVVRAHGGRARPNAEAVLRSTQTANAQLRETEATSQAHLPRWNLAGLSDRLCELSALDPGIAITPAMALVRDAQARGETSAWVTTTHSAFYPPDAHDSGIDLSALVVIRAPQLQTAGRAADQLARSGAFGLIVVDLGASHDPWGQPPHASPTRPRVRDKLHDADAAIGMPLQSRLLGLAQKHHAALLFLSHKSPGDASLSSLVSLRGHVQRRALSGADRGRFVYELTAIKDKRHAPGWTHHEVVDGPAGLR